MGVKAIAAVLDLGRRSGLKHSELMVLVALANRANDRTGRCFPGLDEIAEGAALSRRSAARILKGLATGLTLDGKPLRHGGRWIRIESRWTPSGRQTTNDYWLTRRVLAYLPDEAEASRNATSDEGGEGDNLTPSPPTSCERPPQPVVGEGDNLTPSGCQSPVTLEGDRAVSPTRVTEPCHPHSVEPSEEHHHEEQGEYTGGAGDADSFDPSTFEPARGGGKANGDGEEEAAASLGDRLRDAGLYPTQVGRIFARCSGELIRRGIERWERARAAARNAKERLPGPALLASHLLEGVPIDVPTTDARKDPARAATHYWLARCGVCGWERVVTSDGLRAPLAASPVCRRCVPSSDTLLKLVRELDASDVVLQADDEAEAGRAPPEVPEHVRRVVERMRMRRRDRAAEEVKP